MNNLLQGATMTVCGGNPLVHGFEYDEMVTITQVRTEPELSGVALCTSCSRDHSAIMLEEELEGLC